MMTTFLLIVLTFILGLSLGRNVVDHYLIKTYKEYVESLKRTEQLLSQAYLNLADVIINNQKETDDTDADKV